MSSRLNILDKYATILYWILVVIWMIVIFYFSSQPGGVSNSFSKNITELIVNFIANIINIPIDIAQQYLYSLNHIIRKIAHFTEYLILALLVINAFRESGVKKF
ncbi:MAG TPA: VanZ family protein, partial [Clostridiales bacterium]|nr:VanZ family protein [Clostridiales bacterium]